MFTCAVLFFSFYEAGKQSKCTLKFMLTKICTKQLRHWRILSSSIASCRVLFPYLEDPFVETILMHFVDVFVSRIEGEKKSSSFFMSYLRGERKLLAVSSMWNCLEDFIKDIVFCLQGYVDSVEHKTFNEENLLLVVESFKRADNAKTR